MKIIPATILAIISLIIGYNLYPMLNNSISVEQENYNPNEIVENDKSVHINSAETQIPESEAIQSSISPKESISKKTDELLHAKNIEQTIRAESLEDTTVYESQENEYIEPDSIGLIELKDWTSTHKKELLKSIESHLPDKVRKMFVDMITRDNNFLDSPSLKQDPALDYDWALMMELKIKDLIQQHPLSEGFEIYSVTCKQLTCEIFGAEHVPDSWSEIVSSFFKNTEFMSLIDTSLVGGNSTFRTGIQYVYFKIGFKDVT